MKAGLFGWISKLPVAKWLKPVWKWAILKGIDPAVDWLTDALIHEVQKDVSKAGGQVKLILDSFEALVTKHVRGSLIPDQYEEQIIQKVVSVCEGLKAAIPVALDAGSAAKVEERIRSVLQAGGENLKNHVRAL